MTGKYLIAAALVSACAVTASAQTTTEYYVVQDGATKKCTIVDKKPTTSNDGPGRPGGVQDAD